MLLLVVAVVAGDVFLLVLLVHVLVLVNVLVLVHVLFFFSSFD